MKLLKILILSCFIFALAAKGVLAYSGDNSIQRWEDDVYGMPTQYNSPSFNLESLKNLETSLVTQIFGPFQVKYQTSDRRGAIAGVTNFISYLYSHPPASSAEYFADLGRNLGVVKPVYAQGIGFSGLSNLLPLWKATRNATYIFFILAFLYIGLAIMFRVKISPQAVITIQNALPKLIIALILVTFSYAIVGLMIDMIYVLIYLGVLIIGQTGWIDIAKEQAKFSSLSFGEGLGLIFGGGLKAVWTGVGGLMGVVAIAIIDAITIALNATIGISVTALPFLIIGVISLFCIFKLFFNLLGCYINIILSTITAPFQIAIGVLPGDQGGFNNWFKNLLANILVFPAVALVFLLGWLLCGEHGPTWAPPTIVPSGSALSAVIGFGMLLLLPKIPDIIKNAFKIKPAGYGTAIGQALGPAKFPLRVGSSVAEAGAKQAEQAGTWLSGTPYRIVSELLGRASK